MGEERFRPMVWHDGIGTELSLLPGDEGGQARRVSRDGDVIVGDSCRPDPDHEGWADCRLVRWRDGGSPEHLGRLLPEGFEIYAAGVSDDGSTISGTENAWISSDDGNQIKKYAFRWTDAGGMEWLGSLEGGGDEAFALGMSNDGRVVVGWSSSSHGSEAFRWTPDFGMESLGVGRSECSSRANDVSGDGRIAVGHSGCGGRVGATLWSDDLGTIRVKKLLRRTLSATRWESVRGWRLYRVHLISDDGTVLFGSGRNPHGKREQWMARIPSLAANAQ